MIGCVWGAFRANVVAQAAVVAACPEGNDGVQRKFHNRGLYFLFGRSRLKIYFPIAMGSWTPTMDTVSGWIMSLSN